MRCSVLLVVGCTHEGAALTDPALWQTVAADTDPFTDRPDGSFCPSSAWAVEVGEEVSLEVDTLTCTYLSLSQPSLAPVHAGQEIEARIAHNALEADAPAEAHVAIYIGTLAVLDLWVDIPADAGEATARAVAPADIEAGTPVWLHLHNHGGNTWNVYDLASLDEGGQ